MVRQFLDEMMRVKQRLLDEMTDVCVVNGIEQTVAITSHPDHVRHAQFRKVLRHSRRLQAKMFREFANCVFTMQQRPDDSQTRIVSENLQRLDGQLKLSVIG